MMAEKWKEGTPTLDGGKKRKQEGRSGKIQKVPEL